MKQRLGIAQAMFSRPKLLICDKPTFALDLVGRKEILDILVSAKEQKTVLFSTHILSDMKHICDEIAFLHDGRIVLDGSLDKVRQKRKARGAELELEKPGDAKALLSSFPYLKSLGQNHFLLEDTERLPGNLRFIADKNLQILRLERQEASLEDLFLEVVGK